MATHPSNTIAWLLLRDQHTVPLVGLNPEELKAARKITEQYPGYHLKHTQGLTAIVSELGFDGDFGDYKNKHYPMLEKRLRDIGANQRKDLLSGGGGNAPVGFYTTISHQRRAIADRLFESSRPFPVRIFLPNHYSWKDWPQIGGYVREADDLDFMPSNLREARTFVTLRSANLDLNFRKDQLVDLGPSVAWESGINLYWANGAEDSTREIAHYRKVLEVFRWIIEQEQDGWFDVVRLSPSLAAIVGSDGRYDLVWRNLRETPAPKEHEFILAQQDTPKALGFDIRESLYFVRRSMDEVSHEAEKAYYEKGGVPAEYPGQNEVRRRYLVETGDFANPASHWANDRPDAAGFKRITFEDGRTVLVSALITLDGFQKHAAKKSYWSRRNIEDWKSANGQNNLSDPAIVTALDAFAYLAWIEDELNVSARLLTTREHRELRPFPSAHYEQMKDWDFPWERNPPREQLLSTLVWSEPRFHDDIPVSKAESSGINRPSRQRRIGNRSLSVQWAKPLPWQEDNGIHFIDAWDTAEWVGPNPGYCANRFWEGPLGYKTWGAYKNLVTTFRVVIDLEE